MHKYEKLWLGLGSASLAAFLLILLVSALHGGHSPAASGIETIHPEHVTDDARFANPGLHESDNPDWDYELYYLSSAFRYEPAEVEIPKGATVRIQVATTDVIHGFQITGTNVNFMVEPSLISSYTYTFNNEGEYLVLCNEYCGIGHSDMTSTVKVVE